MPDPENAPAADPQLMCPSAQPDMAAAQVLGIVQGTGDAPRLAYMREPLPASEVAGMTQEVSPTRIFRFAAPCEQQRCKHFDGADCQLVKRVVEKMESVTERAPPCLIRQTCRWFAQEGKAACMRCPSVVTNVTVVTPEVKAIAFG